MSGGGKSKEVTVGYHYYMNMHFSLAHGGVDELLEIRVGDRTAWAGSLTSGSAMVNQPNLFGGEKREGGVLGFADFMPGGQSQPVNPSLRSAIARATGSTDVPAYRGLTTIFFKGFDNIDMTGTPWDTTHKGIADNTPVLPSSLSVKDVFNYLTQVSNWKKLARSAFLWSSMNPYFKPPEFLVRRVWKGWYPEKAKIGEHVNPIHIIYECLTNKVWGLGYPAQDIDTTSFRAAADTVYNEGFGLSMKWTNQTRVQEFIELVCSHINANLVEDRQTGQWRMIMVRDGYNVDNLFELNESNCVVETFQRKTLGETINEVTVAYTRPDDGSTDTVTVQDLANFSNTGQINSQKKEYPGINDPDLAFKVALRDLNTLSKPVAKFTIRCNRDIIGHYPGDVVKVNWPRLGLNGVVIRIGTMNLGDLHKGEIQLEAIEDVFGLPQSTYASQQPIGWVDPARNPEPVSDQKLYELSYYELQVSTGAADRVDWPEDVGFVAVSAKAPNSDATSLLIHDDVADESVGRGEFTPQLMLTQETGYLESTLHVDFTGFDVLLLTEGGLAWLGDELIEVTDFDTATSTLTVNRAVIDTVPARHPVGEKIWFYGESTNAIDTTIRSNGEVVDYKLLTETSKGQLDESLAPVVSHTLVNRQLRPYPPGNVKVDGTYEPEFVSRYPEITFSTRNRLQQTADIIPYTAGDITPEEGVQYRLTVESPDGVVQESMVVTDSPVFLDDSVMSPLTDAGYYSFNLYLESERDGLGSFQRHMYELGLVGYGLKYGKSYGGLSTEGVVLEPGSTSYTPPPPLDPEGEFLFEGEPFYDFNPDGPGLDNQTYLISRSGVLWEIGEDTKYGLRYSVDGGSTWVQGNQIGSSELESSGGPYHPRYMTEVAGVTFAVCEVPGLSGFHIVKRDDTSSPWVNVLGTNQRVSNTITPQEFFHYNGEFYVVYKASSYPSVRYGVKKTADLTMAWNDWSLFFVDSEAATIYLQAKRVYSPGSISGLRNEEMGEGLIVKHFSFPGSVFDLELTDDALKEKGMQTQFTSRSVAIETGELSVEFYTIEGPSVLPESFYRYKSDRLDYYYENAQLPIVFGRTSYWPDDISYDNYLDGSGTYMLNPYLSSPVLNYQSLNSDIQGTRSRIFLDARGLTPVFSPNFSAKTADMRFVNISASFPGRLNSNPQGALPFATRYEGGTVAYSDAKKEILGDQVPVFRRFETSTYWSSFIHSGRRYFEVTLESVFNAEQIEQFDENPTQVTIGVMDMVPYRARVLSNTNVPVVYSLFIDNTGWVNDSRSWLDKMADAMTVDNFGSWKSSVTPEHPNFYENSNYPLGSSSAYARLEQSRSGFDRHRVSRLYPGDTVGVLFDISNKTISFSVNGNVVYTASHDEPGVNLETLIGFVDVRNAKVRTNTGQAPFKYQPAGSGPWGELTVVS